MLRRNLRLRNFLIHIVWVVPLVSFVALTVALASLKFYFLPRIDDFRVNIEQVVSSATKKSVRISQVTAGWDGIKPSVLLRGVQISEPSGVPLLQLEEVRARLSLLSFFKGEFSFSGLELEGPTIELSRDSDGRVWLASSLLYPSPEKSGDKLLDWVVRQESVNIKGAQVTFKDALADDLVIKLDGVDITSSFFREKLTLKIFIRSESELLQTGSVVLDTLWPGSGHELSGVSGKVIFDLDGLNAEILSKYATILDASLNGALSVNGSFEYSPSTLNGLVEFNAKNLTLEAAANGLSVSSITGIADFAKSSESQSVNLSDISMRTEVGDVVGIDLVEINKSDDVVTGNLRAKNLNISTVKSLFDSVMDDDSPVNGAFSGIGSVGAIEYVDLEWRSEGGHLAINQGLARVKNISYVSKEGSRVKGYTGDLTLDSKSLKIVGRADEFSLSSKLNFDEVVTLSDVKADMSVTLADDGLGIHLNDVSFKHEKAKGTAVGDIGFLAGKLSHLGLSLAIDEFNLRDVHRFISNKSTATKTWMKSGLQIGVARNIKLRLSGIPVVDNASQQLKIKTNINADIENGTLQINPDWPIFEKLAGNFSLKDNVITFQPTSAELMGVDVSRSNLSIKNLASPDAFLQFDGVIKSSISKYLEYISRSPLDQITKGVTKTFSGEGDGDLSLQVVYPFYKKDDRKVTGRMQVNGERLLISARAPRLDDYEAKLQFNERSFSIESGAASILGTGVSFKSIPVDKGFGEVQFKSVGPVREALRFAKLESIANKFSGDTSIDGTLRFASGGYKLSLRSNLEGLDITLPAPLNKRQKDKWPTDLTITTNEAQQRTMIVSMPNIGIGKFIHNEDGLVSGAVNFGNTKIFERENRLTFGGDVQAIDLDGWKSILDGAAASQRRANAIGISVDIKVDQLRFLSSIFDSVKIQGDARDGQGSFFFNGTGVEGRVSRLPDAEYGQRILANFKSLKITSEKQSSFSEPTLVAKQNFPAVDAVVDNLIIDGKEKGSLTLRAYPEGSKWFVRELSTIGVDGTLTLSGVWDRSYDVPRVDYHVRFDVKDAGSFLKRVENTDMLLGGEGILEGEVGWNGGPFSVDYPTLRGDLRMIVKKGQFAKVKPGVANLIGLLSLQALPRRIVLDFRDVFSSGFSFDKIESEIKIKDGVASTDLFVMTGVSAAVLLTGDIDFVRKEQDLEVFVTPDLSSATAVIGAIAASPVIGVATFVLQKLFGSPADRLATRRFRVTGAWDHPLVEKVAWGDGVSATVSSPSKEKSGTR